MMKKMIFAMAVLMVLNFGVAQSSVELDVQKIKSEPVPLQTSEYADIWVKVVNQGNSMADDASVEFVPEYPFTADPDEKTEWELGKMPQGEEYRLHFQVKVDENAVHGENTLKFRLSSGGEVTVQEEVPVEVRTDDEALTITSVDFPEKVGPGTSSTMGLTLQNQADSYLKNIDAGLELSSEDLPFITSETTRKRIQKIAPGEKREVSFRLAVDERADNGVYKLPITLDYENEAGTAFSKEELTGVVVGGDSRIEVGLNSRELETAGTSGTITLRIVNRGEGRAKFSELTVGGSEDYEILSSRSIYIGNIDSDDYQTAEMDMYVHDGVESIELPVTLTYRNSEGEMIEEVQDVEVELYTSDQLSKYTSAGGGSIWMYVIIGLAVAGGIYYWRKRKR